MTNDFYDKLVRDYIPSIILKSGDIPIYHTASKKDEILYYLGKKLREEMEEFLVEYDISELADLYEVLETFSTRIGYTAEQILEARNIKKLHAGNFTRNIILDNVIRRMEMKLFDNKNSCEIYIPLETNDDELFIVELLDSCECYLEPLKFGLDKNDLLEYLTLEKESPNLLDFLKYKRLVVNDSCFIELAQKYMTTPRCIRISLNDVNYSDVENFFKKNPLITIRNLKATKYEISVGELTREGVFVNHEE